MSSHPTWVRGLKFDKAAEHALTVVSHPTWVRGLKCILRPILAHSAVAPHVGAWIEISYTCVYMCVTMSHPTWVRGLK